MAKFVEQLFNSHIFSLYILAMYPLVILYLNALYRSLVNLVAGQWIIHRIHFQCFHGAIYNTWRVNRVHITQKQSKAFFKQIKHDQFTHKQQGSDGLNLKNIDRLSSEMSWSKFSNLVMIWKNVLSKVIKKSWKCPDAICHLKTHVIVFQFII